ncbi:MAG: gliding motility-associated protein GldE [Bacteroidetes bacterium]|nr:gliding motility-associated protein GldE [Bacteroidota bacterium]
MLDDPNPLLNIFLQASSIFNANINSAVVIPTSLFLLFLIICCGFLAASENALFSLSQSEIEEISKLETSKSKAIIKHVSNPKKLLATILTGNNFVLVTFVIVSSQMLEEIFNWGPESTYPNKELLKFLIEIVLVTFILLLFGEVIPKVYATKQNKSISNFMAIPLLVTQKIFSFVILPMVAFSKFIDKRVRKYEHSVSADELSHAIDLTSDKNTRIEEKAILKGIVNFGNKTVRQIMRSRGDVGALDNSLDFEEMLAKLNELGYSRLPVFEDNFDNIKGIIYIKEVLPHIHEQSNYNWSRLLKPAFFVPDNKRIDLLLEEFQEQRMHMAIVVDEYGGKLGIVTMEDILEEIFGEINDEFDEDTLSYSKIDENKYVFDGKLLINDFYKITNTSNDIFEEVKGESETIAGMLLELAGRIPNKGETIKFENFSFYIEAVDNRRIKRIKAEIL